MTLHESTFEYLKPTDQQVDDMSVLREACKTYAIALDTLLPDGPDKTCALRKLREVGMWANVTVTRRADGEPRS